VRVGFFAELEARALADWGHLSTQVTASGVHCIAHVPQVGDKAWLHRFYPGCDVADMDGAESRMGRRIPGVWREALMVLNGLNLFVAKVSLDGVLPGGLVRRSIVDPSQFSIENVNGPWLYRRTLLGEGDFVIGGSSIGSGSIYVLRADESVAQTTREADKIIERWPSVEAMLDAQYAEVAALHDHDGTYTGP
jgi:hypothetical protein